jgi:hypothetical protein
MRNRGWPRGCAFSSDLSASGQPTPDRVEADQRQHLALALAERGERVVAVVVAACSCSPPLRQ